MGGCTAAECAPAGGRGGGSCGAGSQAACKVNFSECVAHSGGSARAVCDCKGQFDACLKENFCPADMVQAAIEACEESGCSVDVCNRDARGRASA